MATEYEIRKHFTQRLSQMDSDREKWRSHWQELQEYILPEHGFGLSGSSTATEQLDGGKKRSKILDNTAGKAVNVLAAGMQSGLTSPSRPWFRLTLADADLMNFRPVKEWLQRVEEQIRYVFARSNVYRSLHMDYLEIGTFGTAAQIVLEDFQRGIHCRPFTIGEYWLGVNHMLEVDTFYRSYWATPDQLIGQFGKDRVSQSVQRAYDNKQSTLVEVIHAIEPNDDRLVLPEVRGKKFRSVYFERRGETDQLLRVGGFDDFPIQSPRWLVVGGKVYGASCGMENLGDIKMLQKINEKQLINLDKALEPPLKAPSSLKNDVVNTVPGGITYADELSGRDAFGPLYNVPVLVNEAEAKIANVQDRIKRGFFSDLFLMLANLDRRNMTATEVAERHEEKLLMLGPVLERLDGELLDPLVDRTFSILARAKMLPPPPPEIAGASLDVEYISVLAQAQKMVAVTGLQQFSGFVGSLGAVRPEVFDNVDFDRMVEVYADSIGVPADIVRDADEVQQIRAAKQKQEQMAQQAAMAQQMAQGAKTLSEADLSGNNALAVLTGRQPGITPPPN